MEQIIFQYKILSGDVLKSQADLRKAIELTNKELQDGSKRSVAQQKALETQLKKLTRIYRGELNAGIRQSKKEFDASGAAGVDAYRRTAAQLAIVTRNIKNLRVENKAVPKELQKQFTSLRNQIGKADASVGDFRRNVGNYRTSLKGLGTNLLTAFGFVGGVNLIAGTLRQSIQLTKEYREGLAKLRSITGLSTEATNALGEAVMVQSSQFGTSSAELLNAVSLVGSAQPELLKSSEALLEVTRQADILSRAGGISLESAVTALTGSLNAFNASADDAGRFTDILATSQQKGTARIDSLAKSFDNAGPVLSALNVSFEDSNRLLQALAKGNIQAQEAGTKLAQFFTFLAKSGDEELNPALVDIDTILDRLRDRFTDVENGTIDVAAANKLLGQRGLQAFLVLNQQREVLDNLKGSLNEAGNALGQANINTDTLAGAIDRLSTTWSNLLTQGGNVSGLFKTLVNNVTDLVKGIDNLSFRDVFSLIPDLSPALKATRIGLSVKPPTTNNDSTGVARAGRGIRNTVQDKIKVDPADSAAAAAAAKKRAKERAKALEKLIKLQEEFNQAQINEEAEIYQSILKELSKELDILAKSSLTENIAIASKDAKTIEDTRTEIEKTNDAIRELRENPPELAPGLDNRNSDSDALENQQEIFQRIAQSEIDIEKLTAQERLKIEIDHLEEILQGRVKLGEDTLEIDRQLGQKKAALKDAELAKEREIQKEIKKLVRDKLIETAQSLFSLQTSIDERNFQRQATQVEDEFALKLEAAEGNSEEQAKIQEELEEKRREISKEAFEKRKKNEITKAIIGQAQAIIKAFEAGPIIGPILAAFIAIQTGIQIAKIKTQEFAKTGIIIPNQKSDSPIFTQMGEGGSVPLGEFAKGKRHSRGGIKAILNGRFVEYEQGEFVDKDEYGNVHVINRRSSFHSRDALKEMASQSFAGKGQILSTINNQTKAGYTKAVEGAIIQSITETPGQARSRSLGLSTENINQLASALKGTISEEVKEGIKAGITEVINDQRISQEFENSRSA